MVDCYDTALNSRRDKLRHSEMCLPQRWLKFEFFLGRFLISASSTEFNGARVVEAL